MDGLRSSENKGTGFQLIASTEMDDFGAGFKTCNICGDEKPLVEFHKDKTGKQGRRADCKLCHSASKRVSTRGEKRPKGEKTDLLERAAVMAWKELIVERYL